jgi:hypothetical protein
VTPRRLAMLVALAACIPVADALAAPMPLRVGGTAFWTGPPVSQANCSDGGVPCWLFELEVRESGGATMRVGIDHPRVGDTFTVDVTGPTGAAQTFGTGSGLYSAERTVTPRVGIWKVRVTATDVLDPRFRMRAKIEPAAPKPAQKVERLPNVQIQPPYDFHFSFPVTDGGAITAQQGDRPIGIPMPLGVLACHPEEVAEGALRCLRMSFGVRNVGQGPMFFRYDSEEPTAGDQTLYQLVYSSDGTHTERVAGIARYHPTHMHYHQHEAVALQLFKVTDPVRGTSVATGAEKRKGFHHREELLREWAHFYPLWKETGFGLGSGWADYYEWDRPDNFLDFGLNGDGRYVVRMTADPGKNVLETNEDDNRGYSYIEVAGSEIKVLESGRGTDPWDRCKILMPIGNEPDVPVGAPRPADCPPDTTWPEEPVAAKKKAAKKKARKAKTRCASSRKKHAKKAQAAKSKRKPKRCKKRRRN